VAPQPPPGRRWPARLVRGVARALWSPLGGRLAAVWLTPWTGLHECPSCHADMVSPIHWQAVEDGRWALWLHCGQCGSGRRVIATRAEAADYEGELESHRAEIERTLARLEQERLAEEAASFVEALRRDLIDATDFERARW
jgi:hypothetical protein